MIFHGIEDISKYMGFLLKFAYGKTYTMGYVLLEETTLDLLCICKRPVIKNRVLFYKTYYTVTQGPSMRKHGYGYLQEIMVRRTDNDLYRFKEGDFLRLRINDIKDMLLFFVQNRLTNLSGDDVSDFVISLECSPEAWLFKSESKIFNLESKVTRRRSRSPSQKLPNSASRKVTCTLHIKTLKDSFMSTTMGETG
ncbi:hypothetical protein Tco_0852874 [Tanacetum coccineum]